ncbi:MAG: BON domain-containing protein, partial [Acidobacteria bacterium]|nr:BON domain-containing protein [Acidobacteriota bacterium]
GGYDRERYGQGYEERDERGYGGRGGRGGDDRGWLERASDKVASWFGGEDEPRRGRGPKNYRRSDSRIEEDVNDRLSDQPFLDASDVEVRVENGEVTLSGTVNSRRDKRLAEDIAETVLGVTDVENRIRVRREGWGASTGTTGTTGTSGTTSTTGTSLGATAGAAGTTGTTGMTGGTTGTTGTTGTAGTGRGRTGS